MKHVVVLDMVWYGGMNLEKIRKITSWCTIRHTGCRY